ncbi:type VI secretion protein IcmF/TssM N-terminal domain-containing protein [Variovorax sp. J22R133]|uniref:type VI secretion protein IcmF/TssM N-terminal domain-containing protein n=1 Tax=Variovorax brevis TaxID=3053503 RepID=UPI00257812BC|nr:type VI secretion protein IcmF/TssM N-terminal domain-containing protein [Variovorax sp. J22R133]MDM0117216.1 type VI secretion protein IcmF/TssM N-terminal domain-containing protein [Variovorax sp. J22R133]
MTALQSPILWQVTLACVLAFMLFWWLTTGARHASRRRALQQRITALGSDVDGARFSGVIELHDVFAHARHALQGHEMRPQARHDSLYRVPWILFLGDSASGVPQLLRTSGAQSPGGDVRRSLWRWWMLEGFVAIETDPALIEDATGDDVRAGWYEALLELVEKRQALPLDGMALCVDASSLLGGAQAVAPLAARLRKRTDEASQLLRLRLFTQVVITGLDKFPGYARLRHALPPEMLDQAIGFRVPPGTLVNIDDVLSHMSERMRALRMTLLRTQADAAGRLAVHQFIEQMLAIEPGLNALATSLFVSGSSSAHRLRGRGLYFVAAPADAAQAAFATDMFRRFLPAERPSTPRT